MATSYRYFSPAIGRLAPRFGTKSFVGAVRTETGFVIDPNVVVPIPEHEIRQHLGSYNKLLKRDQRRGPALIEKTRDDYVAYMETRKLDPVPDPKHSDSEKSKGKSKRRKLKEGDVLESRTGEESEIDGGE